MKPRASDDMQCSRKCKLTTLVGGLVIAGGIGYWLLIGGSAQARGPLGRTWEASEQVSLDAIDHGEWNRLLKKHVDPDGYVDYSAWKASAEDRSTLRDYLRQLGRGNLELPASRESQLAFWINAYNAVTIEGILQEYPTSSIRNHTSRVGGYNIWKHLPLRVGSRIVSLEDMEHKILRPLNEPRIHFAIVCASVGCPRLRAEAYTAQRLEQQLADNTRDFFNRSQNLRTDAENGVLHLSPILDWFAQDFGANRSAQLAAIAPYLPTEARSLLEQGARVRYLDYDWNLNDQATK